MAGRRAAGPHRLRHRGDARAAGREGLHHHRPGNRRHGDAGRRRPGLGDRAEEARLHRQARPGPGGDGGAGPAAAGRPRPGGRAAARGRAQLLAGARRAEGHVTSAYDSACLGRPFALGLLAGGRARHGETVFATRRDGPPQPLTVGSPVAWDPAGERLDG
ncbi:glycine cleavage T C-terminal barrel domain-containing protein [Paeniroseomonas aquatica]|uniref:glycine cleavage T C-terminal barrel domain-containing protein n=1 Tax=Paeniroseomonas aquatica TaxID=373043 RepID=UPI003622DBB5